jgi:hypothetical protein
MSNVQRDARAGRATAEHNRADGLGADELRAERSTDLPDREAMSILDVGGVEVGLPPPEYLGDLIDPPIPVGAQPVDGLPVEQYPIDRPPIDRLPVEPVPIDEAPVQPLPPDQSVIDEPIGVPAPVSQPEEPVRLA